MREIRLYGSEGGGTQANGFSLPLFSSPGRKPRDMSIKFAHCSPGGATVGASPRRSTVAPPGLQRVLI